MRFGLPGLKLNDRPDRPLGLIFRFCLFLGLLWLTAELELRSWTAVIAQRQGGPDWFLAVDPSLVTPAMTAIFLVFLGFTALYGLLRLAEQTLWLLLRRPPLPYQRLGMVLRVLTLTAFVSLVLMMRQMYAARQAAWEAYDREFSAAVARLRPGQSVQQAESRLKALGMQVHVSSDRLRRQLRIVHNLGGPDAFEFRRARLEYDSTGRLSAWTYEHETYIEEPGPCTIVAAHPAGTLPRPCAQ